MKRAAILLFRFSFSFEGAALETRGRAASAESFSFYIKFPLGRDDRTPADGCQSGEDRATVWPLALRLISDALAAPDLASRRRPSEERRCAKRGRARDLSLTTAGDSFSRFAIIGRPSGRQHPQRVLLRTRLITVGQLPLGQRFSLPFGAFYLFDFI